MFELFFFLYRIAICDHFFITCKQTSCSTSTVPDLDHFRKILKNSTESMLTVNTTSPLSRSLIMYSIIGFLHELKMAAYFKKPIA